MCKFYTSITDCSIFIKTTQLNTSWKAMRSQWRQLIRPFRQMNWLFC